MGEEAGSFDDIIILTAEDPRNESVYEINEEIKKKIPQNRFNIADIHKPLEKGKKYLIEIPDRKDAIEFALSIALKGDYVVITGKGHEKSLNMGSGEKPWDKFTTVRASLKRRGITI
jgi:UDP-N-acetylmuramoyl-L-alanyl-D-glutamate--2,6-diaminopimelate ligase